MAVRPLKADDDDNEIYLIVKIGEGSYGEVFRAEWKGKPAAAKRFKKYILDTDFTGKTMESFKSECQLLEQTKHPNIVTFYEVIAQQGEPPIIVTELLECDLLKFLCESTTKPRIDLPHTVQIMLDVAEGLNYLHQKGIVHRDLASKNILLTQERRAKIADLGVAKAFESYSMMATAAPGTPLYAAPETYSVNPNRRKTVYTVKVDIFSFGAVLLEVIVGPYTQNLKGPLPPPFTEGGEVVPEYIRRSEFLYGIESDHPLRKLVCSCLENVPDNRPKAGDIVNQLRPLSNGYPITDVPVCSVDGGRVGVGGGVDGSFVQNLQEDEYDFRFKVLILGQQGVGKTSIIERLANPDVQFQDLSGSGNSRLDEHCQQIQILGKWVHLQVVDCKVQERFHNTRNTVPMIFRDVKGAVVVFDLCDMASFSTVGEWVELVRFRCDGRTPIVLVGNKNDMDTRKVRAEHAENFAAANDLFYLESSAKTGCNVDNTFAFLVGKLVQPQQQTKNIWDLQQQSASPISYRQHSSHVPSFADSFIVKQEDKPLVSGSASKQRTTTGPRRNFFQRCCP